MCDNADTGAGSRMDEISNAAGDNSPTTPASSRNSPPDTTAHQQAEGHAMTNPTPAQCVEKLAQCQIPARMAAWTAGCITRWTDRSIDPIIADVPEDGILWAAYGVIAGNAIQANTDAEQVVTMASVVALSAYSHAAEELLHQGIPADHPLSQTASGELRRLHGIAIEQLRAIIPES